MKSHVHMRLHAGKKERKGTEKVMLVNLYTTLISTSCDYFLMKIRLNLFDDDIEYCFHLCRRQGWSLSRTSPPQCAVLRYSPHREPYQSRSAVHLWETRRSRATVPEKHSHYYYCYHGSSLVPLRPAVQWLVQFIVVMYSRKIPSLPF